MERHIPTHAAKAVIRNEHKQILFLQRAVGKWDLPGGLVELGENDQEALTREISEELGVVAKVGKKLGEWSFHRPVDGKTVDAANYEAVLVSREFQLSNEHSDYKWVAEDQLTDLEVKDHSIFSALG